MKWPWPRVLCRVCGKPIRFGDSPNVKAHTPLHWRCFYIYRHALHNGIDLVKERV